MKSKLLLAVLTVITLALGTFIFLELPYLTILFRMLFKFALIAYLFKVLPVKLSKKYLLFIVLILFSDFLSFFAIPASVNLLYAVGVCFFLMYGILIVDGWKQFKVGPFNWIAYSYFATIGLIAVLITLHLRNLYLIDGEFTLGFFLQSLYYVAIYVITVVAMAYYLNSYSKKSMFYLLGTILFVFSDILWGFYFSFNASEGIVVISSLFSIIGYICFAGYFHTKEKSLLIEAELLLKEEKEKHINKAA